MVPWRRDSVKRLLTPSQYSLRKEIPRTWAEMLSLLPQPVWSDRQSWWRLCASGEASKVARLCVCRPASSVWKYIVGVENIAKCNDIFCRKYRLYETWPRWQPPWQDDLWGGKRTREQKYRLDSPKIISYTLSYFKMKDSHASWHKACEKADSPKERRL